MKKEEMKQLTKTFCVYGILGLFLEVAVILSWTGAFPPIHVLLMVAIIPYVLLIILVLVPLTRRILWNIYEYLKKIIVELIKKCKLIKWKKLLLYVFGNMILSCVIGFVIWGSDWRTIAFLFTLTSIISLFIIYNEIFLKKIEIIVFALIIMIGSLYVAVLPISCGVVSDDEAHFRTSLMLSHIFDGTISNSDNELIIWSSSSNAWDRNLNTQEVHEEWVKHLNELYESGISVNVGRIMPTLEKVCYLPSVIGLFVGRVLHLPYNIYFMLGKFMNLLIYAFLIYFSMAKLKYGKMIVAVIAMLPDCIIMAASYTRDTWMIGFIILGFCTLVGEIQQPDKKSRWRDLIAIIVFYVLGTIPKAIYGTLLLTATCIPNEKFNSKKQANKYRIIVVIACLVVLASFVLPYLTSGGTSVQDDRGGVDVNAGLQTIYILSEPLKYIQNLGTFLRGYLSFDKAHEYLSHMHYFGNSGYTVLLQVLLAIVIFTDHGKDEVMMTKPFKAMTLVMSFGAICLAATAMYIAFTPVYLDTINGCQPRYMLQVLLPTVFVLGNVRIENRMNQKIYRMTILSVLVFILLSAIWNLYIISY